MNCCDEYGNCRQGRDCPVRKQIAERRLQGERMKTLIDFIKNLFVRVPPAVTDEHCPYCRGLGYDSSGFTCECLRRKNP
jgi:hypothetical protein